MTILDEILNHKAAEVAKTRELTPVKLLEQSIFYSGPCVSLVDYLQRDDMIGVIAEFKRSSPSAGKMNPYARPEAISLGYMQAGSSALSVLTDKKYFGGSNEDLTIAREWNFCPILRKEFIVDEYQVYESKAIGADVILLIASALDNERLEALTSLAHDLGMEVLCEIHDPSELTESVRKADIIGVNSRSLKEMRIVPNHHETVAGQISVDQPLIAESGIKSATEIPPLQRAGYSGFLIGSLFMKESDPVAACRYFIEQVKSETE